MARPAHLVSGGIREIVNRATSEPDGADRATSRIGRPPSRRAVREIVTELDLEAQRYAVRCPCGGRVVPGIAHRCWATGEAS